MTTWDRLQANVLPKLGPRRIREIEAPELGAMVKEIEKRGAGDIAKRALQTVGQVFRHAVAHGYAVRNKGRMTGHGFRGLASTLLREQGYAHEHIELQLAHAPRNAVSAAYNHALYLQPRARMIQEWADYLDRARQHVVTMVPRERSA